MENVDLSTFIVNVGGAAFKLQVTGQPVLVCKGLYPLLRIILFH